MTPALTSVTGRGAQLLGFGAAQPETTVSGADLGAPFGKNADWIRTRTGIERLRRTSCADEVDELAGRAARDALCAAGLADEDVDLVVTTSCTVVAEPGTNRALGHRIAPRAARMHLNAACSGFCYALEAAANFVRTGLARHVVVLAAEHMSRTLDPADLGTSIIFGDGAGAAVVGPAGAGGGGVGPSVSGSDGRGSELIRCDPAAGGALRMVGQEVFRWAVEQVPVLAREACRRAGVRMADVEVFVPHQANQRITDAVVRSLALEHAVVADDVRVSGNTSAASIPIAITRLLESGRARAGQLALLAGFGAGLSYAAQIVTLPASSRTPRRQPG